MTFANRFSHSASMARPSSGCWDEPKTLEIAHKMEATIEALSSIIESLLHHSQLERGIIAPEIQEVELKPLLEQVQIDNEPQARSKNLRLEVDAGPCCIRTDPALLRRMIENLVGNAIRYTGSGRVCLRCRTDGGQVRIEVQDTGPGIPEESIDSIFEEYVQLEGAPGSGVAGSDGERAIGEGLGLGLSIVKHISQLLDHPLAVRSAPEEGSVFTIVVPKVEVLTADGDASSQTEEDRSVAGHSVLIIDDDASILDSTGLLLESLGHRVATASCGHDAFSKLNSGLVPDLVIIDFRLPGSNGLEVLGGLRERLDDSVPAILMTGDTADHESKLEQAGRCRLLHKPVEVAELQSMIQELVDG